MEEKIKGFVWRGLGIVLLFLFALAALRWVLPASIPFIVAYIISAGIRPASLWLYKKLGASQKLWAVMLIILCVAALGILVWYVGSALLGELGEAVKLAGKAISDTDAPWRRVTGEMMLRIKRLGLEKELSGFDAGKMVETAVVAATETAADLLGKVVAGAPSFFFFFVVLILSLFYFSCDLSGIKECVFRFLPKGMRTKLSDAQRIGFRALARFARAYLFLFLITLSVLTVGFFILRVEYPLLAALLCALVDLLPVFGVGTVLVPWSLLLFVTGKTGAGVRMLIFFCVMYALRQILEPRIVGEAAGVHPLAVLFSVYLGFRLVGVGGMLIAPLILNGVCVFLEEKRKKLNSEVDKKEGRGYNYIE